MRKMSQTMSKWKFDGAKGPDKVARKKVEEEDKEEKKAEIFLMNCLNPFYISYARTRIRIL